MRQHFKEKVLKNYTKVQYLFQYVSSVEVPIPENVFWSFLNRL